MDGPVEHGFSGRGRPGTSSHALDSTTGGLTRPQPDITFDPAGFVPMDLVGWKDYQR